MLLETLKTYFWNCLGLARKQATKVYPHRGLKASGALLEVFWVHPQSRYKKSGFIHRFARELGRRETKEPQRIFLDDDMLQQYLRFMGRDHLILKAKVPEETIVVYDGEYYLQARTDLRGTPRSYRLAWLHEEDWRSLH